MMRGAMIYDIQYMWTSHPFCAVLAQPYSTTRGKQGDDHIKKVGAPAVCVLPRKGMQQVFATIRTIYGMTMGGGRRCLMMMSSLPAST